MAVARGPTREQPPPAVAKRPQGNPTTKREASALPGVSPPAAVLGLRLTVRQDKKKAGEKRQEER